MGNITAANELQRQAHQVKRQALGDDHPEIATDLGNLADLHNQMGNFTTALTLQQEALAICRKAKGADHADVAMCLNGLGSIYFAQNNAVAAEPLLEQALIILRQARGHSHPQLAAFLENLAILYAATDRAAQALDLMQQAAAIDDHTIGQVFSIGSESQRTAFLNTLQFRMEMLLSLVWRHLREVPDAVRAALDLVLRRKAIGAESLAAQRDALLGGKYPALQPRLGELTALRRQIAQKTLAGPGPEGLPTHQQLLAQLELQKEQVEAELARHIPEMNLEQKLRAADCRAVALALPDGVTLVEFVRFKLYDFHDRAEQVGPDQWRHRQVTKVAWYLAFVLPAGKPENAQMIVLGEAEPIDRMIANFRAGVTGEGRGLGAVAKEAASPTDDVGARLRQMIFAPLREALGERTSLFLSPDGDLTRLPFEVLPTERGQRLIDEYRFSYVAAGRDVLRFGNPATGKPTPPVVVGDPDFDLADISSSPATGPPLEADAIPVSSGRRSRDLDRSSLRFGRLAGTRTESEHIAPLLDGELWLDKNALESRLKKCRSPRILHLATHGFFLEDQKHDPNDPRGLGTAGSFATGEMGRFSGPTLENPLLRSGLALAGVNTWLKNGRVPEEAEDGLLTAEDVTGMNLLDTELVVLSACETGLGQVQIGEGVLGLRRSFVLAGAKTLVMSLWKVPDKQTQELMENFYQRILAGEGRAEALRNAQLKMKEEYPDPLYWGAFICQGDPAPLQS